MNPQIQFVIFCFSTALLWVVWQYGWKQFALDIARQKLFSIRDELFDLAADKDSKLNFDDDAYQAMRVSINRTIQFCHRLSFSHFVWALILGRPYGISLKDYKTLDEVAIDNLKDEDLKAKLIKIKMRYSLVVGLYLVGTSVPFLFFMFWVVVFSIIREILKSGISKTLEVVAEQQLEKPARAFSFQAQELDVCPA